MSPLLTTLPIIILQSIVATGLWSKFNRGTQLRSELFDQCHWRQTANEGIKSNTRCTGCSSKGHSLFVLQSSLPVQSEWHYNHPGDLTQQLCTGGSYHQISKTDYQSSSSPPLYSLHPIVFRNYEDSGSLYSTLL